MSKLSLQSQKRSLEFERFTRLILEVKFDEIARMVPILSKVGKFSPSKIFLKKSQHQPFIYSRLALDNYL
jgi:hypothetical protein